MATFSTNADCQDLDLELIRDIVDLEKYPIHELDGAACKNVINHCQTQLRKLGSLSLDGFIRADKIDTMTDEVRNLLQKVTSWRNHTQRPGRTTGQRETKIIWGKEVKIASDEDDKLEGVGRRPVEVRGNALEVFF